MHTENSVSFIVVFGAIPVFIAWCAIITHRSNTRRIYAKPFALAAGIVGMLAAAMILKAVDISKYQETDLVFGVVFVLWFTAAGGLIGAFIDRFRFGRSKNTID